MCPFCTIYYGLTGFLLYGLLPIYYSTIWFNTLLSTDLYTYCSKRVAHAYLTLFIYPI